MTEKISKICLDLWKIAVGGKEFSSVLNKVKLTSASNGKCTAEMVVNEDHVNSFGVLHSGFAATVIDVATTVALISIRPDLSGISVDLHISYQSAAKIGQTILIEAKTDELGKTLAHSTINVFRKDTGDVIASGSHVTFVSSIYDQKT